MIITKETLKSKETSPFYVIQGARGIVVTAGDLWPTGVGDDNVIPLGVAMAPVGTTGRYSRIAASTLATALASSDTQCYLACVDGFATGDTVSILTATYLASATFVVTAVDHTNEILSMAALAATGAAVTGLYVERMATGYSTGGTFGDDCVFLGDNVQTDDENSVSVPVPARGIRVGMVEVADLEAISPNCYNGLVDLMLGGIDFIPRTPGV